KGCVMNERILIVDDDPVQRRLLDNMVRKFGYESVVAEGGDAALAVLTSEAGAALDAVVLDLVMPDLDGLGVLAKMREAGLAILGLAEKAANSAIPVLIEGQSGVGKELIARAIHGSGARRSRPFVAVNCGAIPDNLVESILFGHEKGAFTGATERHTGKFVEA